MNRQITSLKFTQMSRIYLSIYLSALEDILIMIIYLLTGRPHARKTHTQPGRPDFFFVAWNSLKYGENSYCIAYFNESNFTQHLVKIGLKLVLNSFSSLKLQNPRPGGGGGYSHIRTVRVCGARKPPAPPPPPHFSDLATLLFRRRPLQKPFQKYTILCSAFPIWADRKDRRFKKKIYVSVFPVRSRSESTPPPTPHFQ